MSDSGRFTVVGGTAAVKEAMADKTIPQDTFLPLLDAPLDDLATYLAGDSWEARKRYLNNMMSTQFHLFTGREVLLLASDSNDGSYSQLR